MTRYRNILLQTQEGQAKYADAVQLNRDNNNLTVRASLPVACPVQHAAAAPRPPRGIDRPTGTTNTMTTQKVAHPVQQARLNLHYIMGTMDRNGRW